MRLFLTGATGFLGSHVAELLSEQGHQLIALVRPTSNTKHLEAIGVELIEGILPQTPSLSKWLSGVDGIIHIAGAIKAKNPVDFFRINQGGTQYLVNEAISAPILPKFFLHISTIAVHRPNAHNNFCLPPEQCQPLSHYGESKLQAEFALRALKNKIPYSILRPPVLYGPKDTEFLPFFKAIRFGVAPVLGGSTRRFSVCFGPDVAEAIVRMCQNQPPDGEIYSIDDGQEYTWKDLADSIAKVLKKKANLISFPVWAFYLAAFLNEIKVRLSGRADVFTINKMRELQANPWVCGNEKLYQQMNWRPATSLEAGMRSTLEYYRRQGFLPKVNSGKVESAL